MTASPSAAFSEFRRALSDEKTRHCQPRRRGRRSSLWRFDFGFRRVPTKRGCSACSSPLRAGRISTASSLRNQAFVHHIDRDFRIAALPVRLPLRHCKMNNLFFLDSELQVLHVACSAFRGACAMPIELDRRSRRCCCAATRAISIGVRTPATTSSPCALGIRYSP